MKKKQILQITKISIVATLYVVLTVLVSPLSYGDIQIRFSEVLLLLCFFDKRYSISLIVGCALSNLFSPLPLDFLFGTVQTIIASIAISYLRPLFLSLLISDISMIIIGLEIALVSNITWWLASFQVMLGETIVLFGICYPLSFILKKSETFKKLIKLS